MSTNAKDIGTLY
jgi:heme/copper-type cytochrome/quinol oxidase subunit 1